MQSVEMKVADGCLDCFINTHTHIYTPTPSAFLAYKEPDTQAL